MERKVVITGIGAVSPFGIGIDVFWKGLMEGQSKIKVVNRQRIGSTVNKTIAAILDCENWPTFIPTVKKIEIIEQSGNYMRRILHSEINNVLVKMMTETVFKPNKNEIEYTQVQTPWPLKSNKGTWKVQQISNDEVELELIHIFEVKYSIIGYLFGLLIIGPFYIYLHNKKDLKLYKNHIENNA